jgi:hypothetical protein
MGAIPGTSSNGAAHESTQELVIRSSRSKLPRLATGESDVTAEPGVDTASC